jgi:SAM-dependent methyltransferase
MKLNLGCGHNKKDGYVNLDKYDSFAPDVVWDLETFPWPFETDAAEEIVLHHCLEHLGATVEVFFSIMQELYRVSAPGGRIVIDVPHPRSSGFVNDPTHVRAITPEILSLFSKKNNEKWKKLNWPNSPLAIYLDIDFDTVSAAYNLMPWWLQRAQEQKMDRAAICLAMETYFNVVDEINIVLEACKEPSEPSRPALPPA